MNYDKLQADIKAVALKHGIIDHIFVFTYPDLNDHELVSLGSLTVIEKESPYEKDFRALKRALITGKFLKDGD